MPGLGPPAIADRTILCLQRSTEKDEIKFNRLKFRCSVAHNPSRSELSYDYHRQIGGICRSGETRSFLNENSK